MTRLQSLKPRLATMGTSRLQLLRPSSGIIPRKRGSAGVKDRINIKTRDCGLCQECRRHGRVTLGRVVDHIKPLWDGGSDEDDNKQLLCDPCHDEKTIREASQRARMW